MHLCSREDSLYLKRGGIEESREMIYKEEGLDAQGNCVIYNTRNIYSMYCLFLFLFINNFSQNLYIRFSKFLCIWLRIFNLQKLMQFNFWGRFAFRHKGQKLGFSRFFQNILPSDFLGLVLNNSTCKPCVKKFYF